MKIRYSIACIFTLLIMSLSVFATENKCALLFTGQKQNSRHELFTVLGSQKMAVIDQVPNNWNGKTKVLIPGLSRSSLFYERHSHYLVEAGFRVIRPDPFNSGKTLEANTSASQQKLSLEADAQAIAEIIHSLNLPEHSVELIGHSRGAGVAIKTALALDPRLISRVNLANPFVRWLSYYAEKDLAHNISNNIQLLNLMTNPWASMYPATAVSLKSMANSWGNFFAQNTMAMAEANGNNYFRNIIQKKLEQLPQEEKTDLNINDEVNGIMTSFNNLKNVSVLSDARKLADLARQFEFDVRILTTNKDDLVPPQAAQDLRQALRIGEHSAQDRRENGDHFYPSQQLHDFINWILER